MNQNDDMTPQEYADLVRDARALVAGMERATRRTATVFVIAMGATIAATALDLDPIASFSSVIAVLAFASALILLMARIALGPAPAEVATTTPAGALSSPANGSAGPATGSGPATAETGVIPTK